MQPADLRRALLAALDDHHDGHLALLFHPFLVTVDAQAIEVIDEVLGRVKERGFDTPRMDEAAARLLDDPDAAGAPVLDTGSWS
jgi:hypothetical protein